MAEHPSQLPDRYVARCLAVDQWGVWDQQRDEFIFGSVLCERAAQDLAQRLSDAYRRVRADAAATVLISVAPPASSS